jgi:hypothetical protein
MRDTCACATAMFLTNIIISIAVLENVPGLKMWDTFACATAKNLTHNVQNTFPHLSSQHSKLGLNGEEEDGIRQTVGFFNAFIHCSSEVVVHLCDFWHAAFHVLRGPRPLRMREP